ncbi:2-amino-4-hydroxy-6-hydroxymethyldihydropteridinediphosphokinase [Loktanella fryxellensis]|uniref:2-amino-4-hydroxy-6-hydroxymethyldihydropteridine pyrophosphokinase n=1 Tax=Loktanella fryxellensis TaxID=245187 RepID=A0A1H8IH45_9RHOB|nr:2-amino-4-hydroxy-6-hydroxymethyldihydropteridine diphosphokinase [Loktanella fryxellensis]SEN68190.1 2-amino-4-hydroxy-6-hydroxymethyldihydropteridinediphosphokinase [Loktanella fryxellensis]
MTQNGGITLVSLGSNASDGRVSAASFVLYGRDRIRDAFGSAAKCSRLFATPAYPPGIGSDFVNAAVAFHKRLSPDAVLAVLHGIEGAAGRRRQDRWGPRTLDIDLLAQGDLVLPDIPTQSHWRDMAPEDQRRLWPDRLILPHPRLQDRAFVLVPLMQVAPDWVHPILKRSVAQMRDALPRHEVDGVRQLDDATGLDTA